MNKNVLTLKERTELKGLQVDPASSALQFGGKKLTTATFFIAGIGANVLSLGNLIDGDTTKKVGYTNFPSGNKLPKDIELEVLAVRMLFDKTTASVTPLIAVWNTTPDPSWLNGNLTITQGMELFKTPITDLANIKASTGNDDDFRAINPFRLRSEAEFNIIAELAGAVPAGTAWRLELRCDIYTGSAAVK